VGNHPLNAADPFGLNKECAPDTVGSDGEKIRGKCKENGEENDDIDQIVVTAWKNKKIRVKGPEQFFTVTDAGVEIFDADSAEDCGTFVAYKAAPERFGSGDPGHSHPNGSRDTRENTSPAFGPDDGAAAKKTGRAYKVFSGGVARVNRSESGGYTATLVAGRFGQSKRSIVATLTKYGQNDGSVVAGGATKAAENAGKCTPMRTH